MSSPETPKSPESMSTNDIEAELKNLEAEIKKEKDELGKHAEDKEAHFKDIRDLNGNEEPIRGKTKEEKQHDLSEKRTASEAYQKHKDAFLETEEGKTRARKEYLEMYREKNIHRSLGTKIESGLMKIASFLGVAQKDSAIYDRELSDKQVDYEEAKELQEKTRQLYVTERLRERAEAMKVSLLSEGKSEAKADEEVSKYLEKVGERYKKFVTGAHRLESEYKLVSHIKNKANKKTSEEAYAGLLEKPETAKEKLLQKERYENIIKNEYRKVLGRDLTKAEIAKAQQKAQEQLKSLEPVQEKSSRFWNNKVVRNTIGNKWVRFALTTGTVGALTGGFSGLFLVNRAARFLGGMAGGRLTKWGMDKLANEEKIYTDKLKDLAEKYEGKEVGAREYDEKRENIELYLTRVRRAKQAAILAGAAAGGILAGQLEHNLADRLGHSGGGNDNEGTHKNPTEQTTPDPNKSPVTPPIPEPHHINPDAYIHKGEGIEHTFRRQIEGNLELAHKLGYHGGDHDLGALHKFSGEAAHRLALQEGYVDGAGHEVWVNSSGIDKAAYEIVAKGDGTYEIHEYFGGEESDAFHHTGDAFETQRESYEYGHNHIAQHKYVDLKSFNRPHVEITHLDQIPPKGEGVFDPNSTHIEAKTVKLPQKGSGEDLMKLKKGHSIKLKHGAGSNGPSYNPDSDDPLVKDAFRSNRFDQKPYESVDPTVHNPGRSTKFDVFANILDMIFPRF
jgi:hypothetical protein